jgi:sorting nexin-29
MLSMLQVAEMHGELLEFNESLQRAVAGREATIVRLRAELGWARGPLPGEEGGDEADNVSVGSGGGAPPGLVNIWVPSVFQAGQGPGRHHVYQVYLRVREAEWNVYRRYSQFHLLHQGLKRTEPVVSSFGFPPKRTVGNRGERFVEDRRRALQSYLRSLVNYMVATDTTLSSRLDKERLLHLLPFLGEAGP